MEAMSDAKFKLVGKKEFENFIKGRFFNISATQGLIEYRQKDKIEAKIELFPNGVKVYWLWQG